MKEIKWQNKLTVYPNRSTLPVEQWKELCSKAAGTMQSAHAPYSKYLVGAAVLLEDGSIVVGSNQENAVYPLGVCAERVALLAANAQHPDLAPTAIVISTLRDNTTIGHPAFPCGSCRQTLIEVEQRYNRPIDILLVDNAGEIYHISSVRDILPFAFDEEHL